MKNIYDNGEILLGKAKDILKYMRVNQETFDVEDYQDIKEDLEEYLKEDKNTIVAINYDSGMGYSIDWWNTKDKLEEEN